MLKMGIWGIASIKAVGGDEMAKGEPGMRRDEDPELSPEDHHSIGVNREK